MTISRHDVEGAPSVVYRGRACFPHAELVGASEAVSMFQSASGIGIVVHATGACQAFAAAVSRTLPMNDGSLLAEEYDGYVIHVRRDGTFTELGFACEDELALAERDGVPGVVCVHHDRRTARFYGFDETRVELAYPNEDAPACEGLDPRALRLRLADDTLLYEWRLAHRVLCIAGRYPER